MRLQTDGEVLVLVAQRTLRQWYTVRADPYASSKAVIWARRIAAAARRTATVAFEQWLPVERAEINAMLRDRSA